MKQDSTTEKGPNMLEERVLRERRDAAADGLRTFAKEFAEQFGRSPTNPERQAFRQLILDGADASRVTPMILGARKQIHDGYWTRIKPREVKRVSANCVKLANDLARIWSAASRIYVQEATSDTPQLLSNEGRRLRRLAAWFDPKRRSKFEIAAKLMDYLRQTTGSTHTRECAQLLGASETALTAREQAIRSSPLRKRKSGARTRRKELQPVSIVADTR